MTPTHAAIRVHSPLTVKRETHDRYWEAVFWAGGAFDFYTPFRAVLRTVAEVLGQDADVDLLLPPYEDGEDFIEGTLRFGAATLDIYFEYCLGYLSVMHADRAVLDALVRRVQPYVTVVDSL